METSIWQEFRSDEFGFVVQFPSTPTHTNTDDYNLFTSKSHSASYKVMYQGGLERIELPKIISTEAQEFIKQSLERLAKTQQGGRLISHDVLPFHGYPSADFNISYQTPFEQDGIIRGREIWVDDGFYIVMVASTSSQETDAKRFIDSFRLLRENASIE